MCLCVSVSMYVYICVYFLCVLLICLCMCAFLCVCVLMRAFLIPNCFQKYIYISFDVSSLFTNIPLEETLDFAVKLIFENSSELKITREELKELFVFCTSKTNFIFDGVIYDQIDGIATGLPLAPTFYKRCRRYFCCF